MDVYLAILLFISLIYLLNYLLQKNRNYWKDRGVPYIKPLPFFGNYKDAIFVKKHVSIVAQEICQQFPDEPYIGTFYGLDPALLIQDPVLLKTILTKDFYFCNGREASEYNHKEALMKNVFSAEGDYWKILRTNLSPLFSSAKLKNMFYLIKECADTFEKVLEEEIKTNSEPDKRKILTKYTMDCIVACAFGVKSETLKNQGDGNIFTSIGNAIFNVSIYNTVKGLSRSMWPKIFYALGLKMFTDDVGNFFTNLLNDIFKSREVAKSSKNDFVDLILTWKKQKSISGDSFSNFMSNDKKVVSVDVTDDLLVSQCMVFFAAGFETTATTTSFLLYELARNQHAQSKVIEEVDEYFQNNKEIEYECINSMPYTESCLQESLRLYPVLGFLTREVMSDYTLPTGLYLKKGTRIHISVNHLHHNPKYFPEPEKFLPERFFGEERKNIIPYSYIPFGEGPRICIGMRFAKMPIYAALLKVFKKYRIELADDMPNKLDLNPKSLIPQFTDGIRLKFTPR